MTASTVRSDSERGVIRFHQAVRLQLRLLWLSRRPLMQLVAMAALIILVNKLPLAPEIGLQIILVPLLYFAGPTWAFAVWAEEPPSARNYMWSQPANRTHQSLARLLAGLVWLWAMLLILLGLEVVTVTLNGYADELSTLNLGRLFPINFAWGLNLFVGATIGYLMLSSLLATFERPFWWMVGLILLWALNWDRAARLDEALGDFSPLSVIIGGFLGGPNWWIAWPLWVIAFSLLAWGLARVHPDWLARWPSRILRRSPGD